MRIGFDFRMGGSINAGIGRYCFELLQEMLKQGEKQDTFVVFYSERSSNPDDLATLSKLGAKLVVANYRHYSFAEQLLFPRLLLQHNLDLVHFPNFNIPILYKKPFVVTIHDMVHHKISGHKKSRMYRFYAYQYVIQTAAKNAKKIITVTEAAKAEIVSYLQVDPNKVVVTYEAPATHEIAAADRDTVRTRYLLSRPYFLFVGTLERKKNVPMLTKAFDIFLTKYKLDMDLVIAGKVDQHYPEVKEQALDITHRNRLVFTGYIEDDEQVALYQGAYAFITASLHEGFGLPGLEAMRYGVPVLASNTPVFNEVYDNGAIYFDPLNPEDIAKQMYLVASDVQFHAQMQQKSVQRVQLFDWARTAEETLAVYTTVIGNTTHSKNFEPEQEHE